MRFTENTASYKESLIQRDLPHMLAVFALILLASLL